MALGGRISTWFGGRWHDGNLAVMGAADHGTWQGTLVFDGARAFEGVTPDLDLHCARTRARVIGLLRDDGFDVREASPTVADFHGAEEIFLTGNASKVLPVTRFEDRELGEGPVTARARALYWDYAHAGRRAA